MSMIKGLISHSLRTFLSKHEDPYEEPTQSLEAQLSEALSSDAVQAAARGKVLAEAIMNSLANVSWVHRDDLDEKLAHVTDCVCHVSLSPTKVSTQLILEVLIDGSVGRIPFDDFLREFVPAGPVSFALHS